MFEHFQNSPHNILYGFVFHSSIKIEMKNNRIRLIIVVFVLILFNSSFLVQKSNAGTFTNAKVTISDSRASQSGVQYDFAFTASANTAIKQITIRFCTAASGTCTTPTGMVTTGATRSSDNISGSGRTDTFLSNGTLTTVITSELTQSPTAITASYTGITNPSTTNSSFFARVTTYSDSGATEIDSVSVAFAILTSSSIAVSADVGNTFSFTVSAVTTGSVNNATINISDTTATTIPFGLLNSGSPKIAAHDLNVISNSSNGYMVTVKSSDPPLTDGSNNIDIFTGTNSSPITWSSPNGSSPNVNTAFFGYTTNDSSLGTGTAARFTSSGGNKWAGTDSTPYEVAYNSGLVVSGETTRVGWQAEVNSIQPPGTYSGTVILVATPTY